MEENTQQAPQAQPAQEQPAQSMPTQGSDSAPTDGQSTASSSPPPPAAAEVKEPSPAERFAAAARRERALRAKERQLQQQESELRALREAKELVGKDPRKALEYLGTDYASLTESLLSLGAEEAPPTPAQLAAKIAEEKIREYAQSQEKAAAEREQARINETIKTYQAEIRRTAETGGDAYQLVNALGATDRAWQHIETSFYKTGKAPTIQEALAHVEGELLSKLQPLLALAKVRSLVAPAVATAEQPQMPTSPTLTNRGAAEVPAVQRDDRPLSREEALRRAIALL